LVQPDVAAVLLARVLAWLPRDAQVVSCSNSISVF
jgi:hypothetical protein